MNCLVVDDSSTMRKIVGLAVKGAGHTYEEAEDGLDGLSKARAGKFNIILLDVNMPRMNGIEFLKERGKDSSLRGIPVIVLTTQDEEALKVEALGLGAEAFLVKPFQKEKLLETVAGIMKS